MTRIAREIVAVVATALAVLLVGCNSGSDSSAMTPSALSVPPATPTARAESTLSSPVSAPRNVAVAFTSVDHGWLVRDNGGRGEILVTNDGGTSWVTKSPVDVPLELVDIVDENNAWVSGCIPETSMSGHCDTPVFATHDGGATWTKVLESSNGRSIAFYGPDDGWVVVENCNFPTCGTVAPSLLLRTTHDGGATWGSVVLSDHFAPRVVVARPTRNDGWILTPDSLLVTHDDGASWRPSHSPCAQTEPGGGSYPGGTLDFVDTIHGWIGCNGGAGAMQVSKTLYGTVDGGLTWNLLSETERSNGLTPVPPPAGVGVLSIGGAVTDLHFFNATSGWLDVDGPQNVLYRTDDGGQKWNAVDVGASGIEQLFFIDEAHGWALGGVLLRTTDGGAHWQNVNTPR